MGEFILEVTGTRRYELRCWPSRRGVGQGALRSGAVIENSYPFRFTITGRPRVGDRFRILVRAPEAEEYGSTDGQILYVLGRFCEIVAADPTLRADYGPTCKEIRALASDVLNRHERDWLETGRGAGAYRESPSAGIPYPNRIMPHNKYLCLARAWLVFSSISRRRLYEQRATAMARHFRRALKRVGDAWEWSYWDWVEAGQHGTAGPEDTDHSQVDVGFAVEACRREVVFRPADMRRFSRTLLDHMWNGSLERPRIGRRVHTQDGSAVRLGGWIDLSQWEPKVFDVLWALYEKEGHGSLAPTVLQGWLRRMR